MDLQGVSLLVEQRISQSHPPMGISQRELQIHSMGFSNQTVLAHFIYIYIYIEEKRRSLLAILQWWAFNVTVIIMIKWIFRVLLHFSCCQLPFVRFHFFSQFLLRFFFLCVCLVIEKIWGKMFKESETESERDKCFGLENRIFFLNNYKI